MSASSSSTDKMVTKYPKKVEKSVSKDKGKDKGKGKAEPKSKDAETVKEAPVKVIVKEKKTISENKRPVNSGKRWNLSQETDMFYMLGTKKYSFEEVAMKLGRTPLAIEYRLCMLAEQELLSKGYFQDKEWDREAENICNKYFVYRGNVESFRNFQESRNVRKSAKVLAKHNVSNLLRQMDDGLYIKVAPIPSTSQIQDQMKIAELEAKIAKLQAIIDGRK